MVPEFVDSKPVAGMDVRIRFESDRSTLNQIIFEFLSRNFISTHLTHTYICVCVNHNPRFAILKLEFDFYLRAERVKYCLPCYFLFFVSISVY